MSESEQWRMPVYKTISRTTRPTALAGIAFAALAATPAYAATDTANLGVSAEVISNCEVSTTPVAFGNVNVVSGSNVDATGGLSVTCTTGTAWEATADAGLGTGATLASRKMADGAELLNYALYTNAGRTTVWGDGDVTSSFSDTGNGAAQASTIYARIPAGQTSVPVGSYADTVTVTVTYL
jgi:spore coat protein U-like protein